ncbi:hypothetical protein CDL12_06134 [Handroanthus impetiginosus]|uniref:DUF7815 domain-containing protein n=1 Tax=Handroanthus impetiginosus TaxID=429701 RepID=A0A2G9HUJ7_9LAMI|nr:hypothetical protein CDL12_06134 [Handroanthus impetiginosus]
MSHVPHELIRQVQISTRAAAGLSDYNPADPTLPALPPLSAAIAASDPSPLDLRCKNCKGRLLRGSESIICVYCGRGPHYDVVPDPICFTSTTGYQWLLRSLRLNGSEMVNRSNKNEQDQGQSLPKALTPLSDYLNFKIAWPAETEKEEASFSEKFSDESKRSLSLTGVAPDKFFLKSSRNILSDMSTEQLFVNNRIGTAGGKDDAAINNQNLFDNVQSSEPADSSSKRKTDDAFSGWEADFQSADSENQHVSYKSSDHFASFSTNSGFEFQDSKSFDNSKGLEVDLSAHIDSVFGPQKDPTDVKPKDDPAVSAALDDWNSDDLWNNLSSNPSNSAGGLDSTVSSKNDPKHDHAIDYSKDLSTSVDLFQDFQLQTNYTDVTENKTTNEEPKSMDEDSFDEWNDFTGSTSLQVPSQDAWTGSDHQVSTSDQKPSEIDLFSFVDNKFNGGDSSSFSQPDLFSTSMHNSNAPADVNNITSQNLASDWFNDASVLSQEAGQAANNAEASEKSTNDEVKKLISQMHDLSFMLETDLCIPSNSDTRNSPLKD